MPSKRLFEETLAQAYDQFIDREAAKKRARARQDAMDKGDTIEETMTNVYDRLHPDEEPPDRRRRNAVSQPYDPAGWLLGPPTAALVPVVHHTNDFRDDVVTRGIQNFFNHRESMPTRASPEGGFRSQNGNALGIYGLTKGPLGILRDIDAIDDAGEWQPDKAYGLTGTTVGDERFKASPEIQHNLLVDSLNKYEQRLQKGEGRVRQPIDYIGQTITLSSGDQVPVTRSSLLVMAHRWGAQGAARFLDLLAATNWRVDPSTFTYRNGRLDPSYDALTQRLQEYHDDHMPEVWADPNRPWARLPR